MNALVPQRLQAYAPYRFTWEEVLRMAEAGLFEREDGWRVELIEGELIAVPPQSLPHIRWKAWFNLVLVRTLDPNRWTVIPDSSLVTDAFTGPQPDTYVYPASVRDRDMTPDDVVLLIEVTVSSHRFDLGRKARLYAEVGVQEYWVADVPGRRIVVHSGPRADGTWSDITTHDQGELSPSALPELVIRLADLPPSD
jgi:Uma2 family endonuclease